MKKPFFLALSFILAAVAANGQSDSDPGRDQVQSNSVTATSFGGGFQSSIQPQTSPITPTTTPIAEAITPDIQDLAQNLDNNPTRIFNFVHDQIRYVHYFGSKKGAELTLLERSGNDFDQCALLVALLRAANYTNTGYQFGLMVLPYDAANDQDMHHWLGLSLVNSNWLNTSNYLLSLFVRERGFPVFGPLGGTDTNNIIFQRVWVTLVISGTTNYLDPSFKVSLPVPGTNLPSAMSLSSNTLWTAAAGTDTNNYVTGLNEGALRGALQACNSNLLGSLSNNLPNATVAGVIGGQQIVSSSGLPLNTSLMFTNYTNANYPMQNWTNQPTNFMSAFSISLAGSNYAWYTPQLEGQRVSLTFSNNGVAQVWVEDTPVLQVNHTSSSNTVNVVLTATHPYGNWSTSLNVPVDTGVFDKSMTNAYQATNASYAIMYAFEANPAWLTKRQQKLDAYLAAGYTNGSRQVTAETLNVMGLGWMVQTELAEELLSHEMGLLAQNHHRFGRMAQELARGYYVDVYLQLDGTFPATGYNAPDIQNENQVFDVSSYFWSAMEHGIIEQLQDSNLVAASTVKMIEIASTNGQKVYLATNGNWSSVSTNLTNYSAGTVSTLDALINNYFTLLLPQNGSNEVAGPGSWAGDCYVELGTPGGNRAMAMMIGSYNGGYVSDPFATVNAPFVSLTDDSLPTFYIPQPATVGLQTATSADPVSMVDGSFQVASSDLTLGGMEPRGLNLTRYYSSARLNANPAGMAPGWLHSYYCNATGISDPESALGNGTVQQMAPLIVATCAALNFYNNTNADAKNWTVTALIAKWGIDQLIANAVSVNLGNSTLEFTRQPNGSYTPPANCTMTLTTNGGVYWLSERHGRTFQFNTNSLLTNIVDQYGQTMSLTYTNKLVHTVTDWTNRTLTFAYTGSNLTSVTDGTRTVYYGYSGGELTSYTDPASKTSTYAYDSANELLTTSDALNNLIVSNIYDGLGHVTNQFTEGNTNKMWQIYPSGYQTVLIDPAGGLQTYYFDSQSRQTGYQDALGNLTQTLYDGQDHVLETISPRNETNQFIYDGNNDLIETIDPLGHSNVFTFDTNFNLIAATDGDGNVSHFGYNAQFSLTGSTNGHGDWVVSAFNGNGTLSSRQDAAGTAYYGYDTYRQLNSITYPGSLGSESFVNNACGDPTSHTNPRGFVTTFAYNPRRQLTNTVGPTNLTISAGFDAVGNQQSRTDGRGNITTYNWSPTRHPTGAVFPAIPAGTPTITNFYDNRDWLTQTQNPLQQPTFYSNNVGQQLIALWDALSRTNTFLYDPDGHQTNATDAANETTSSTNDPRGLTITVKDAAGGIVGRAYDAAGNTLYLTNRDGKVWQFQFDGANRVTNTISPTGKTTGRVFSNRGLLASVTVGGTNTFTFQQNAKGRMVTNSDNSGTNVYTYDPDNNVGTNSENGQTLTSQYDAYDRLSVFNNAAGYTIKYGYDNNGNVTTLTYPGNLPVSYTYDNLNRLTSVTDWSGRVTTNTYDLAGHLTTMARPNGTLRTLSYDADGEVTNIVERYTTGAMAIEYIARSYNTAARVQWEFVAPLPQPYTPPSRTLGYDSDNRLVTVNSTGVTMDSQGNMTYGPGTNGTFGNYTYDARNCLTGAGGLTYGYDPGGYRTAVTNGSTVYTYVIDPRTSQVLMRIRAGVTNYYIYGLGLLYEIDTTATTTNTIYYHFDARGSTVALTDTNGNVTDRMEYSAYGMPTYRFGTNNTPFLYNGRYGVQTDPNGLMFMRARYYNPYICRFLNADPSGFGGGLNVYQYAGGNPVSQLDPFGLGSVEDITAPSWVNGLSANPAGPSFTSSSTMGFLPSGPFPYLNGTGMASSAAAYVANMGSLVGNSVSAVGNAAATTLGAAGQFEDYALNQAGVDPGAVAAMVPGLGILGGAGAVEATLPSDIAATFSDGQYTSTVLQADMTAYRYSGGISQPAGRFLTTPDTVSQISSPVSASIALNLPAGATAQTLNTFTIPAGTRIFTGGVAGGASSATQIFIQNPNVLVPH